MRASMRFLGSLIVYLCLAFVAQALDDEKARLVNPEVAFNDLQLEPTQISGDEVISEVGEPDEDSNSSYEDDDLTPADWTDKNKPLFGVFERVYAGAYDKINSELVKQVPTDNAASNIEYAKTWLNSLNSGATFFKDDLKAALEQFIELEQIIDNIKCNRITYGILMKNLRGVRQKAIKYDSNYGPIRRVDKIVFKYAMEHAIQCLPKYPALMHELTERKDLKVVERIARLYVGQYNVCNTAQPNGLAGFPCKKLSSFSNFKPQVEGPLLVKTLLRLAAANSTDVNFLLQPKHQNELIGRMELDRSKVLAAIDKYIVDPCRLFVREVGLNIVKPTKMDFAVLDQEDVQGLVEEFNTCQFCVGRQRYSLCKIIIRRREVMTDSLMLEMGKNSYEDKAMKIFNTGH